jgi:hypothetical protein
MNSKTRIALAVFAALGSVPAVTLAQGVQQTEAIASSDVLRQISMYSYKEGPKSDVALEDRQGVLCYSKE